MTDTEMEVIMIKIKRRGFIGGFGAALFMASQDAKSLLAGVLPRARPLINGWFERQPDGVRLALIEVPRGKTAFWRWVVPLDRDGPVKPPCVVSGKEVQDTQTRAWEFIEDLWRAENISPDIPSLSFQYDCSPQVTLSFLKTSSIRGEPYDGCMVTRSFFDRTRVLDHATIPVCNFDRMVLREVS